MKILVPLADGLEEIEAITCVDVLRRADIGVVTVGLENVIVNGSHGIKFEADKLISEVKAENYDGIILPGGMPGAKNLKNNKYVVNIVKELHEKDKLVAAICAAPIVLEKAGVIKNCKATSYPGFEEQMSSCNYSEERVVKEANIITARGPGVAMEFALTIVSYLTDENKAKSLKEGMLAKY